VSYTFALTTARALWPMNEDILRAFKAEGGTASGADIVRAGRRLAAAMALTSSHAILCCEWPRGGWNVNALKQGQASKGGVRSLQELVGLLRACFCKLRDCVRDGHVRGLMPAMGANSFRQLLQTLQADRMVALGAHIPEVTGNAITNHATLDPVISWVNVTYFLHCTQLHLAEFIQCPTHLFPHIALHA